MHELDAADADLAAVGPDQVRGVPGEPRHGRERLVPAYRDPRGEGVRQGKVGPGPNYFSDRFEPFLFWPQPLLVSHSLMSACTPEPYGRPICVRSVACFDPDLIRLGPSIYQLLNHCRLLPG